MKIQKDPPSNGVRQGTKPYEPARLEPRPTLRGGDGRWLLVGRLLLDLCAISLAHFLAWHLRFRQGLPGLDLNPEDSNRYGLASIISTMVLFGLLMSHRLYDEDTLFPGGREYGRVIRAALQTLIVFPALAFISHTPAVSRAWMLMSLVFATAFLSLERATVRLIVARQRKKGRLLRPVIVIDANGSDLAEGSLGNEFQVLGRFDVPGGIRFLESLRSGDEMQNAGARSLGVIVAAAGLDDDAVRLVMLHAGQAGCQVFVESPMQSVAPDRMTVRPLGSRTVVRVSPPALSGRQALVKRAFDLLVSGVALLILSPILLVISAAVLVTSGRPILYKQERVGLDGQTFSILKFRSMRTNSETASGPVWASANDPRRTRIGAFLRRTSLDELPQLWNVVRGDMSLVGPRPERPNFVDEFTETIPWYLYRHRMRPGITGWAQVHGLRGNTPLDKRVSYDNWYIEHYSLGLDIKIGLLTLNEVFRGEHAY